MNVAEFLKIRPDDLLRNAGPPVHVTRGIQLRRMLAPDLHV